ncbi:hypothetical protein HPB52_008867 [Rhipicephalus sanguineus]|uniref:Reverse transcriptase domain-containing protein n=1 Tax=Rhipicephalus sanguineus TaxID=34632 RepID=A0A9D4PWE6_RHISA|nr:hypothetical protein HPB52_008867 [Rhipicephalus sanguineus]
MPSSKKVTAGMEVSTLKDGDCVSQKLEASGCGYSLRHKEQGRAVTTRVPALIYADDIALLAHSPDELQALLDICGDTMATLHLRFNPQKCGVMVWGPKSYSGEFLERRQREAGRVALGVHQQTPIEAIQGDVGRGPPSRLCQSRTTGVGAHHLCQLLNKVGTSHT